MANRSWWHANSTANNSRERRYHRQTMEAWCKEDLLSGEMSLDTLPERLAGRYDISVRAAKRILKEVRDQQASQPMPTP